jgi:hypothetical protein
LEYLGIDRRITLKWVLKKEDVATVLLKWFRTVRSGELLRTQK